MRFNRRIFLKTVLFFTYCSLLVIAASGQASLNKKADGQDQSEAVNKVHQSYKALQIGDKVPDIAFDSVLNYASKTARLSDFKSKLIILDFWSTSCSSCIGYFPHFQKLKNEFKDDLQIILVNGQTRLWHDNGAKVKNLLISLDSRIGINIRLPVVLDCKELDGYFPYQKLPHEVWINENGIVVAITGAEEVTAAHIKAIIEGKMPPMRLKRDIVFDLQKHSLSELFYGTGLPSGKLFSSSILIRGLINGLGGGTGVRHADSPFIKLYTGLYLTNEPLLSIYQFAYGNELKFPRNRIFAEGKNASLFDKPYQGDTSVYQRVYSYDLTLPPTSFENMLASLRHDLERTFQTKLWIQDSVITCFVLQAMATASKSRTKGGKREYVMDRFDPKKYVRDFPFPELTDQLNLHYFTHPLIDETEWKGNVDIDFPYEPSEAGIIQALTHAGFKISVEKRKMKIAVISDGEKSIF